MNEYVDNVGTEDSGLLTHTEDTDLTENGYADAQSENTAPDAGVKDDTLPDLGSENGTQGATDYESIIAADVAALKAEFPELATITDVTDLNNPMRYAALRDLGLTPAEAYLATAKRARPDTRAHLRSARGKSAVGVASMSYAELATAREIFPGKNDAQIEQLYKRVSR